MSAKAMQVIRMQILWNRLIAVVEEQAQTLMRTAFSPIVREAGDLSAGVFDIKGRMLAQAVTGTPGHVNSMAESVKHFLRRFPVDTMSEGDIYITNDPWMGTGHLNDFVLTTPCFHKGRIVALFSCTSHLTDVGGIGFGPDATDVLMEGIHIPLLKFSDRGRINETLMEMVRANTRQPVESEGDVYSLAACNDVGCERLVQMMREFDLGDLEELADHICETSALAVRREIAKLPAGEYRGSMRIDGYEKPLDLVARLTIDASGIEVDFDGTSPKSLYGVNVPMAYTAAYTCFGLSCIVSAEVPNNHGSLSPFTVRAPKGCVLNAPWPAPVCSRHVIGQMLPDVIFGALAQAIPERVPAEGASCLWNVTMRGENARGANQQGGALFAVTAVCNGGTGARPGKDGLCATAYPSGVRGTPVEINESVAPVIFRRKELRADSGGVGRWQGGLGQVIEIESAFDRDFELLAAFDRVIHPARGREGGSQGDRGGVWLASGKTLKGKGTQTIPRGDRLILHTPGGGGLGDPRLRDPKLVAQDLLAGRISRTKAFDSYGIEPESKADEID
ncbi:hydantoinase B/oxoprolinase family protein [Thioalkalivibrio sp. HK1]|uniref:hydantoinase B/oxoprolinase family protein n=1 Tax=Thioalkalivibrio sp. HK1 TaxID=1469245 RepID=UPI000472ED4B|nr:hydantoinase B/oxoprolinase family protein [Thioalkalivibrio sp. HK1]